MSISTCLDNFFTSLYDDYCFKNDQIQKIKCKLGCALDAYGESVSGSTGFIQIFTEAYDCFRGIIIPSSSITHTQLGIALFGTLIITAVFIIIVALILLIMGVQQNYGITIGLILLMATLYIISVFILIHNASNTISEQINQAEIDLENCVAAFNNAINQFATTQTNGIATGLCSYGSLTCDLICPQFVCPSTLEKNLKVDFESKEYGIIGR